jgi:hypothetical protein
MTGVRPKKNRNPSRKKASARREFLLKKLRLTRQGFCARFFFIILHFVGEVWGGGMEKCLRPGRVYFKLAFITLAPDGQ